MSRCTTSRAAVLLGLALLFFSVSRASANSAPVVSNVQAAQIAGTGQVRITFDVADADGDQVTARFIASSNNGGAFDLLPVSVSGDCNHAMTAGTGKVAIWNAAADYPGRAWTQVVVKVFASDGPAFAGEMVLVPAGTFTMGSSIWFSYDAAPPHTVTLDAFYIDKFEVTNAEFGQFIAAGGYTTQAFWSSDGWGWKMGAGRVQPLLYDPSLPGYPVAGVTWYEAEAYANFAGKRLPTEAEWERAARGDDGREFPWGNAPIDDARLNKGGFPFLGGRSPVGFYDGTTHANPVFVTADGSGPYGTFDQAGNVMEWVGDWQGDYPTAPVVNPLGPLTGSTKVIRGGDQLATYWPNQCVGGGFVAYRTTSRLHASRHTEWSNVTICGNTGGLLGFRCAKSAP